MGGINTILEILNQQKAELLQEWINELLATGLRADLIKEAELREECREFLDLFADAMRQEQWIDIQTQPWAAVREMLSGLSRARSQKGFTPSETAIFVFSFKQPFFNYLRRELAHNSALLVEEICNMTQIIDRLGLWTIETYQKSREEIILRQQEELLELSTPVVKLWDGILALPIIGTLDSARTQTVMESLLQKIVETGSDVAIIDITGVPTVDTLTAQHLLKTVSAARLMGADCIISGIRPQIAQTIVYLGVDLQDVITKSSLADAFALALQRRSLTVTRSQKG
ncbi:MAG: STAS domain-containing protein [Leptolyngbyaceae cyanobacterium bins.349]|nr:STAS domain-containing protein [Leptolyngbyaceae cyanobacterium bins.349]